MRTPRRPRVEVHLPLASYTIYAVGDIHGCVSELRAAERRILDDIAQQRKPGLLVLLGDYVDRGPQSRAVLDHLCSTAPPGLRRLALCGNHDDAFLQFIRSPKTSMGWIEFGGRETLRSYGVDVDYIMRDAGGIKALSDIVSRAIPREHIVFLEDLPIAVTIGDYFFVHAGIRPGLPISEQIDEDFLWIREPFLTLGPKIPLTVVHGHTITSKPIFSEGRIGIDTAAYLTGRISILKIYDGKATVLDA